MSMTPTLTDVEQRFYALLTKLGADPLRFPFATMPQHDGSVHVELEGPVYCYVVTERGSELERRRTARVDELLYWLLSDAAWTMASDDELARREPGRDVRRLIFETHVHLLSKLDAAWAEEKQQEYRAVLRDHPFNDELGG